MAEQKKSVMPPAKGAALGIAAIMTAALALIQPWEGLRRAPYRDLAGIPTVCYGETRVAMRHYGKAECDALLHRRLAGDFGPGVLKAVPALADHPGPFVASLSLAYNIGLANFARSTAARRFNAGNWRGGCDAFLMWNRASGRYRPGLARRRAAERQICLEGLR